MKDLNIEVKQFDNEKHQYQLSAYRLEESKLSDGVLELGLTTDDHDDRPNLYIELPMTPTNVRELVDKIIDAGYCRTGETDARGRFNFGKEFADTCMKLVAFPHDMIFSEGGVDDT